MSDETRDHRKMLDVVAAWFDEADMAKAAGDVRLAATELDRLRSDLAASRERAERAERELGQVWDAAVNRTDAGWETGIDGETQLHGSRDEAIAALREHAGIPPEIEPPLPTRIEMIYYHALLGIAYCGPDQGCECGRISDDDTPICPHCVAMDALRRAGEVHSLTPAGLAPAPPADAPTFSLNSLAALREAGGSAWDDIDDPEAFLRGDDDAPAPPAEGTADAE